MYKGHKMSKKNVKMFFAKNSKEKGFHGEDTVVSYLIKKKHRVLERNLKRGNGEVDVVTFKDGVHHFVEVKSVYDGKGIAGRDWPIEEKVNRRKIEKIVKVATIYLEEIGNLDSLWCIDVVVVVFDSGGNFLDLQIIENVIF